MIPKIIFNTGFSNKNKWPDIWFKCIDSQKAMCPEPEFRHIFFDDEDCLEFVMENYSQYYDYYISLDHGIKRADTIRYMFLHKYGGIYADMDYEFYCNIHNLLPNTISIVQSHWTLEESVQNSLMASPPNHKFWLDVMDEAVRRGGNKKFYGTHLDLLAQCSTILLQDVIARGDYSINILPKNKWMNMSSNQETQYAKHHITAVWTKK